MIPKKWEPVFGKDHAGLKHDPEKWEPVFGKDHVELKRSPKCETAARRRPSQSIVGNDRGQSASRAGGVDDGLSCRRLSAMIFIDDIAAWLMPA